MKHINIPSGIIVIYSFYENMDFIVGLLCDYRFDEANVFHTALESKFVFNNLSLYLVPEYLFSTDHSFNVLCGAELYFY